MEAFGNNSMGNDSTLEELAKPYVAYQVGLIISRYVSPILILIGFFGNTLSFIVMALKHNRQLTCCVYLAGLAISDTITVSSIFILWIVTVPIAQQGGDLKCKFIAYFLNSGASASAFTIVAVTADRFLATCVPVKSRRIRTRRWAFIVEISIFIFSFVVCIPFGLNARFRSETVCSGLNINHIPGMEIYAISTIMLYSVIPFVVIFIMNIAIIRRITQLQKKRESLGNKLKRVIRQRSWKPKTYAGDNIHENGSQIISSISPAESPMGNTGDQTGDTDLLQISSRNISFESILGLESDGNISQIDLEIEEQNLLAGNGHVLNSVVLWTVSLTNMIVEIVEGKPLDRGKSIIPRKKWRRVSDLFDAVLKLRSRSNSDGRRFDKQLSRLLLIVSFTFLVLTLPQYVRYTVYFFIDISTPESFASFFLFYHISQKLHLANSAINFILYCIGTTRFRQDAKKLLCGCYGKDESQVG